MKSNILQLQKNVVNGVETIVIASQIFGYWIYGFSKFSYWSNNINWFD
jgi:hypothetical protein